MRFTRHEILGSVGNICSKARTTANPVPENGSNKLRSLKLYRTARLDTLLKA